MYTNYPWDLGAHRAGLGLRRPAQDLSAIADCKPLRSLLVRAGEEDRYAPAGGRTGGKSVHVVPFRRPASRCTTRLTPPGAHFEANVLDSNERAKEAGHAADDTRGRRRRVGWNIATGFEVLTPTRLKQEAQA